MLNKLVFLLSSMRSASKRSSRSYLSLLRELIVLRYSIGRIGLSEYLDFQLYKNDLTLEQKLEFGGYRAEGILEELLVDDYSKFNAIDKVTMYALLDGFNVPIPTMYAVLGTERPLHRYPSIGSVGELGDFLAEPGNLPVYVKRAFGSYGRSNTLVERLNEGQLTLGDGATLTVGQFYDSLRDSSGLGWILQQPLSPHTAISEVCGEKISGLRIHTNLTKTGPRVSHAIWKINVGGLDSDNFAHGESGNLLGSVNLSTGVVERVVTGVGAAQRTLSRHPITRKRLEGFTIPHWQEAKTLTMEASKVFPGYLSPGWDIAICDEGPKVLEVNFWGDLDLSQHAYRRGFIDRDFQRFLDDLDLLPLLSGFSHSRRRMRTNNRLGRRKGHWKW